MGCSIHANVMMCSLSMTRAITAQCEKESRWICLIDLKGDKNFTLQNQLPWRVKSLGFVCSPSFFSLPTASHLSHVGLFLWVLTFHLLYYSWGKMGDFSQSNPFYKITKIVRTLWLGERWVCMRVSKQSCDIKMFCFLPANHTSTNL